MGVKESDQLYNNLGTHSGGSKGAKKPYSMSVDNRISAPPSASPHSTNPTRTPNMDVSPGELLRSVGKLDLGGCCTRNGQGQEPVSFDSLVESCQVIGLYFSAHWCPPCKAFTPQLIETYGKLKGDGYQFEIIFVSSDRSESSYQSYLSGMPWPAIPYASETRQSLASLYNVHGIPSLILLAVEAGGRLDVITTEARHELSEDPDGEFFPWPPKLVNVLSPRHCPKLYDSPALILFIEGEDEDEIEFAETVLLATAEYCHSTVIQDNPLLFFVSVHEDINTQLRSYLHIKASYPNVVLVDFPRHRFSQLQNETVINKNVLIQFVSSYFSKDMAFQSMLSLNQQNDGPEAAVVTEEIFL
ncbi:hypothetical protein M8J75_011850 [Diaphorina citri]|nr:hypothetical protein M8J75_011850 [Diaphorina citri]